MVTLDVSTLVAPVGIVRMLEVVFTCVSFSLVVSVGHLSGHYWTWCMWTWCFCFAVTLIVLVLEFTHLNDKIPISWDDFTSHFSMLATLKLLAASVIYPTYFTCSACGRQIGASVTSLLAFVLYATEVGLTRAKPGQVSGLMSTVAGHLKTLEAFVACIIFTSLERGYYARFPGLQWCVAVYSVCFAFTFLLIICTIGRLLARFPVSFGKVLTGCNVLSVLLYMTAMVIWPLYSFQDNPRLCGSTTKHCAWDKLVVISVMTGVNLVAYIVDTFYSMKLVFVTPSS